MADIELRDASNFEGDASPSVPKPTAWNSTAVLACTCCFLIYVLQMVGLAKISPHNTSDTVCVTIPWLKEKTVLRAYYVITEIAYLPSFAWGLVECLRSAAVDIRIQSNAWSTYTKLMASTTLLCFYQLAARILMDSLAHDYVNGVNLNDPMAVLGFVTGSTLSYIVQCRLFAYADHIMGSNRQGCCRRRRDTPAQSSGFQDRPFEPPRAASACVWVAACLIGLRAYHSGVLLAGYGAPHWLSTLARFSRISYRFLMAVAHFLRASAYLEHPLNERLSAQMRSNMATLSQMMVVAIVLGTSTDFLVVARGVVQPDVFSQDFTDAEMDTLNNLFTQWLPVTLIITGTIDKRAPQQAMNDLRACGFNNGLVLFFLYLGTFLFGAWGARAILFASSPAGRKVAELGGGALALAKGGAGMMYFAMPALFVTVLPFMVNLVNKAANVSVPMWPGEGLTFITYHRNAAHLFVLAVILHAAGHIWSFVKAGSVEKYTNVLWQGNAYAWLWPWGTGVLILLLGLILYISFWVMKRQCYDFFIRNKRVLGSLLLVLAGLHGFTGNFGPPRLWWFMSLILCLWIIDRTVKRSRASQISCSQRILKMLNAQGQFNGAILVLRSEDTFVEAEPGAVLLQVVGVNGRHPLTQIAYPSPSRRNRWQVEYHIRLQPNAEKQNWAHRLYDHARAREGTEEPIHLEVAGPMNTLGTFGQEELLKDVHRLLFVAIGVGFTGCVHPMFHAHEAEIPPEAMRLCIRTPSPEYADAVEPVCAAYGLRRGEQLRISISEDSSQAKPEERQSRSQWGKMLTGEVDALSKGGGGLVLLFCCGPSPAVQGVQKLFLDDMRVRMIAEAFG
eukprot:s1766_g2.t1